MKKKFLTFFTILLFSQFSNAQFDIPEIPKTHTSIYDYVELLNHSGRRFLKEKIIQYADSTSTQIVIIIIESTKGEKVLDLATRWGNEWGIGQKDKNNGIVLLMARTDRKVAISIGKGIQNEFTDSEAKKIIDFRIVPKFKEGRYYKGLEDGIEGIFESLKGKFKVTTSGENFEENITIGDNRSSIIDKIFNHISEILFFIIIVFALIFGKKHFPRRRNDYWDDRRYNDPNYWNRDSKSRTFSSSDTGFDMDFDNDYDGGSFGGGGASGSW